MELRNYQHNAVNQARDALRAGLLRLIIYGPTGSGKTEIGMEFIRLARQKNKRVIFLANRIGLIEQTSRRFYKSGIEHGLIQGANTRNMDAGVLVCSIQTLARRGFPKADLFLIDEAHGAAASEAYRNLITQNPDLPFIGLSATPFSKGLGKIQIAFGPLFQKIIKSVTIRELIDLGYLVDVDIWSPSQPDLSGVKIVAGDYNETQLGAAVDKAQLVGDIVTHWKRLANGKPTVCFAVNIAHSKHIAERFNAAGIKCEHIDCYTEDEDRRAILARLDTRETQIVTNCAVLAEGWDQPSIECMICARPTRSLIRWIQMSGRALRAFPGKERAMILDHSGTALRLGFPTDDLPLELDDGKPRKAAERESEEPLPKECPSCHYLKPPKTHKCPMCQFAPEKKNDVETQDGKLEKMQRKTLKKMTTAEREVVYAELLGYARKRKIKDGWAYYACKELFGSAPRARLEAREPSDHTRGLISHLNIKRAKARAAEQQRAAEPQRAA